LFLRQYQKKERRKKVFLFDAEREVTRGGGNGNGKKKTDVPSSGQYCVICNMVVAKGDPDRRKNAEGGVYHERCLQSMIAAELVAEAAENVIENCAK
jgi:hypothetical protein